MTVRKYNADGFRDFGHDAHVVHDDALTAKWVMWVIVVVLCGLMIAAVVWADKVPVA